MAEMISVKADLDETMRLLKELDGNKVKMRRRVLSGIGQAVKSHVKKSYKNLLHKQSGDLYKSLNSKVIRSGKAAIVSPSASHDKVRYGYVPAKGSVIKPKNKEFLTFRIGDKWIRKHEVTMKPNDWVEGPAKQYLSGSSYKQKLDALLEKEIQRAEKAAQKK